MDSRERAIGRLSQLKRIPGLLATAPSARADVVKSVRALAKSLSPSAEASPEVAIDRFASVGTAIDRAAETRVADRYAELFTGATREQLAAFARVGLAPFQASDALAFAGSRERAAAGAAADVVGFVRSGERVMLETRRLLVEFAPDISNDGRERILREHGLIAVRSLRVGKSIDVVAAPESSAIEMCKRLLETSGVLFAEPDLIEQIGVRAAPNDPGFRRQWHLENRGGPNSVAGADIRALAAWARTTGNGMRIAVIDGGFDTQHGDLRFGRGSAWFRSTATFDDADFVSGTTGMPDADHGTACAGMATAIMNNNLGGTGVAPSSELVAIACLPDQVGTQTTLARAVAYAAVHGAEDPAAPRDSGADVIACSLGPNGAQWDISATLSLAIDFATTQGRAGRGTPVFWAVTNGNYPIKRDQVSSHPNVIRVGRSTCQDADDGSGHGPELDFLAPGVSVCVAGSHGSFGKTKTGTSFACPCAAAVGALVLSRYPDLTPEELRRRLRDTCDKVGNLPYPNGRNDRFGYGRINADRATA